VLLVAWITIPMWVIWAPDGWLAPGLVAGAAFALLGVWAELAEPVPYQDEEVDSR
jgi:hypothetical protein